MASELTNYTVSNILGWVRGTTMPAAPTNVYVALYTGDPGYDGLGGTEVTEDVRPAGRLPVSFGSVAARAILSNADVEFGASETEVHIDHFAFFDAATDGNMLGITPLDVPRDVTVGDPVSFLSGDISVSFANESELSTYLSSAILNWIKGTTFPAAPEGIYVSLHDGNPGPSGTGGTDVTATVRPAGRVEVTFAAEVDRFIESDAETSFGLSDGAADVDHFALWDAASSGNSLGYTPLDDAREVIAGDPVTFLAAAIRVGFPTATE